jgi:hypothetical protein
MGLPGAAQLALVISTTLAVLGCKVLGCEAPQSNTLQHLRRRCNKANIQGILGIDSFEAVSR